MTGYRRTAAGFGLVATCVLMGGSPAAQDSERPAASIPLQCEVFCSQEKLRTANARLTWADPRLRLIREAGTTEAAEMDLQEEIETTVFKNGFEEDLYASFPTSRPDDEVLPTLAPRAEEANLRAYQLHLIGVRRPTIAGRSVESLLGERPEDQQASAVIEGLEPGLTYYWRVRLQTPDGREVSQTVACDAPVCPADMQEGEAQ